jgi:hypothetical protein
MPLNGCTFIVLVLVTVVIDISMNCHISNGEYLAKKKTQDIAITDTEEIVSSHVKDDSLSVLKEYIDGVIKPFSMSGSGERTIRTLLQDYELKDILNAIDISAETYLRYSDRENPTKESVEEFLEKLGGILFNRNLKPVDQKLAYIKNRATKNFSYFNSRVASTLLRDYVGVLQQYGRYTNEQVVIDLETELSPALADARNWTEWRGLVEGWIEGITKWSVDEVTKSTVDHQVTETRDVVPVDLDNYLDGMLTHLRGTLIVLGHILSPYPSYNFLGFKMALYVTLVEFYDKQKKLSVEELDLYEKDEEERSIFTSDFSSTKALSSYWSYDFNELYARVNESKAESNRLLLLMGLDDVARYILDGFFEDLCLAKGLKSSAEIHLIAERAIECLNELIRAGTPSS